MAQISTRKKPHAVFIPYPLQGHVIPAVHLAIKLASQGFTITFITTQAIHHKTSKARTKPTSETEADYFSEARELGLDIRHMTISDGFPIGFDRSLNHDQFMEGVLHVFSAHVEDVVARIVESGKSVDCLIADTFFVWPSKIAKKFGLLYVSFWTEPALIFSLYYHMDLLRLHGHFACQDCREDTIDYIPGVKGIEPKDLTSYLQESDTTSVVHRIIFKAFSDAKSADFVICNTVQELEDDTISALHSKIPFYSIGPIFPMGFAKNSVSTSFWSESDCTNWLDSKPHGSVLYASFGSYAYVTKSVLAEIAHGISLSKVSFVWVLRDDIVSSDGGDPLPDGYREEVADRSMIVQWCNQKRVLTHPAIGGFLTHCGWNSILESIWSQVPLLCYPLLTDQFTNRKLVVDDWKIGINLSNKKLIKKEDVSESINRLMCGKSGDEFRSRAKVVKEILENALTPNGSSEKNMAQFIKELETKIEEKAQSNKSICNGA